MVPQEKIENALTQINDMLSNKKSKTTVLKIQKLCGLLNFLCRAIVPGHPFLMRLYHSLGGFKQKSLKLHHHIKITADMKLDLNLWRTFFGSAEAYSRPFIDIQ